MSAQDKLQRSILPIPDVQHVIDLGKDAQDADHFIDCEERLRVMMARQ
jgi:hypothetical protein